MPYLERWKLRKNIIKELHLSTWDVHATGWARRLEAGWANLQKGLVSQSKVLWFHHQWRTNDRTKWWQWHDQIFISINGVLQQCGKISLEASQDNSDKTFSATIVPKKLLDAWLIRPSDQPHQGSVTRLCAVIPLLPNPLIHLLGNSPLKS